MAAAKVIVGLSGGVDSSVAALELKRHGYDVAGLFMKNWEEDDDASYCAAKEDLADAQAVAEKLAIPLHTVNFSTEYWDRVFTHFLAEYRAGRTPNPDVLCNREIKFGVFREHAKRLGGELLATGHYARTAVIDGQTRLLKAADLNKDQSYFLYRLNQRALSHSLFALGELSKPEVRSIAQLKGLPNFAKKDSTGICFIGERKFKAFLGRYLPAQPGNMVSTAGEILGRHQGLMYHTIGQREGLGIGGTRDSSGEPWYVVGKNLTANELVVAQGKNHPALFRSGLAATDLHWIAGSPPALPLACCARIRYRQRDQACEILARDNDSCTVRFATAQRAVTPGQAVVFYQGDLCLGGGTICV